MKLVSWGRQGNQSSEIGKRATYHPYFRKIENSDSIPTIDPSISEAWETLPVVPIVRASIYAKTYG